jgi:hypothetical protein
MREHLIRRFNLRVRIHVLVISQLMRRAHLYSIIFNPQFTHQILRTRSQEYKMAEIFKSKVERTLKFEFFEGRAGWDAWVTDSQGVRHKIKGIHPSVDDAEKSIIKMIARKQY